MKANVYDDGQIRNGSAKNKATARKSSAAWLVLGLILLSAIPVTFGVLRLHELANGAEITPDNARFFTSPMPVVFHIVSSGVYALLGAFQFVSRLWRRGNGWHRWVGRVLVPFGLIVGLSGIWMTLFYAPSPEDASPVLYAFRLLFGSGMVLSIVLGFVEIRRGNVLQHRAWMTRAYAIGMGAGTQVLTGMAGALIFGTPNAFENALLMGAAWAINLAVAEWSIRKRSSSRVRSTPAVVTDL